VLSDFPKEEVEEYEESIARAAEAAMEMALGEAHGAD
jgi:hypothetical protein